MTRRRIHLVPESNYFLCHNFFIIIHIIHRNFDTLQKHTKQLKTLFKQKQKEREDHNTACTHVNKIKAPKTLISSSFRAKTSKETNYPI